MEDDLFGTSIWGASTSSDPVLQAPPKPDSDFSAFGDSTVRHEEPETGDDFDDFGPPPESAGEDQEDDFGDFGDFGDVQAVDSVGAFEEEVPFAEEPRAPLSVLDDWKPLQVDPIPSKEELEEQVDYILRPIWAHDDYREVFTDEDVRQAEGPSQILVSPESREFYKNLFKEPPTTKVPNWTRSEIRRRHLIALGIPVNLDEILPKTNGKALPPLQITTRPMSAPPGPRGDPSSNAPSPSRSRVPTPRSGTPQQRDRPSTAAQLGLGPKPDLDQGKVDSLLSLDAESMALMPLPKLESCLRDIRAQTANASALLTYLLQTRDALQQDSETYNSLIAELISEAQKTKVNKGKTPARRSSGMR
ncbi:hypothetical protein GLOTRDRAFT_54824 [Gloeophyllum trabeum ATCC 11539]|uniref:Uncharacterized protein n=1 Tax=Gloeophyllum trabeum (strain ATCC 11539 / FP-39264 / Madison 617) TaxID=670483 RepID=S7QIK8_GLOTA|nr:uncharacterized protein GLOTRDRAFT_54824 [Gloeophyllum trabeum ATCC 11539]EPQ59107.1 hypothetical protein GLOTRDRAFT_54824 [Gloeophyllum trabeum ATCC 11539]